MFSDKLFLNAIVISFFIHGVILAQSSFLGAISRQSQPEKIEINYVKSPKEAVKLMEIKKSAALKNNEPFLKLPPKITAGKIAPPQFLERENLKQESKKIPMRNLPFSRPALAGPDIISVKKKISLPLVNLNKNNSPSYISYYQVVREKIRRSAYQNYSRTETGEVLLSFIIVRDGTIRDVRIVEEKTTFSPYLRDVALRSVYDAAPFPIFPKELDYPELSFNVVVSFEIE